MLEAQLRDDLLYIYELYSKKGISIGTVYYVYKDVLNEIATLYNNHLKEELQKQQEQKEEEE